MKRKVLSVMLATAMTATLFAGCGSDASNADSANSADATASTTEAGDAKTDAAASGYIPLLHPLREPPPEPQA